MTASLSTNKALDEAPLGFGKAFIKSARQIKNLHLSSFAVVKADLNHGNISQSPLHVCGCRKSSTHVQHLNNEMKFDFPHTHNHTHRFALLARLSNMNFYTNVCKMKN